MNCNLFFCTKTRAEFWARTTIEDISYASDFIIDDVTYVACARAYRPAAAHMPMFIIILDIKYSANIIDAACPLDQLADVQRAEPVADVRCLRLVIIINIASSVTAQGA